VRVLRADARVVQTRRDRVRLERLPLGVLHEVAHRAVEDAGLGGREPGGVPAGLDALSPGLDADEPDSLVGDEAVEDPHGIGPSADARDDGVGQATGEVEDLLAGLLTDALVEAA